MAELGEMHEPVALALPPDATVDDLARRLHRELGLTAGPESAVRRTWYDTIDWRLYSAGLVLEHERVDAEPPAPGSFLRVRELGQVTPRAEVALDAVPERADDLPGPLAELVRDAAGGRALAARCEAEGRVRILRLVDGESKTVLRVVVGQDVARSLEDGPAGPGDRAQARLAPALVLAPVRGHEAEFAGVRTRFERALGGEPAPDPLAAAATAVGLEPGLDPSAFVVAVPPDASAPEAVRLLLSKLLAIMAINEPGVLDDADTEYLHDFRVAVRRARSIAQAAKGVIPEAERTWLADELRWLGQETTPVRDLDVTLEELADPGPELAEWRDDLGPLLGVLAERRAAHQAELVAALQGERYRRFLAEARRFVASEWGDPDQPATDFVHQRLRKAHRNVLRLGGEASTPEQWHEVRKAAKKLRYLLEGFRALLPPKKTASAVSTLKKFQETLGAMQDSVVHAELTRSAVDPVVGRGASPAQLMALGGLLQHQLESGHRAFERCADRFAHFASNDSRQRFKALWHAGPPDAVEEPTAPEVPAVSSPPLPPPPPLPSSPTPAPA